MRINFPLTFQWLGKQKQGEPSNYLVTKDRQNIAALGLLFQGLTRDVEIRILYSRRERTNSSSSLEKHSVDLDGTELSSYL